MKALLLSNVAAVQFSEYVSVTTQGAGSTFIPADKTIIMTAFLASAQDLSIMLGATAVVDGNDMGANSSGFIGSTKCNGTLLGYKNIAAAAKDLHLYGVTMS